MILNQHHLDKSVLKMLLDVIMVGLQIIKEPFEIGL